MEKRKVLFQDLSVVLILLAFSQLLILLLSLNTFSYLVSQRMVREKMNKWNVSLVRIPVLPPSLAPVNCYQVKLG